MNKRNLIFTFAGVVVLLLLILIFSDGEEVEQNSEIVGNVTMIDGSSEIKRNDEILGVQIDMNVENKDEISTKSDTKMQILFIDKTLVTLGSKTEFSVEEYLNEGKNSKVKLSISKGAFKVISGNIGKVAPKNFHVKTKNSFIGIRGTEFTAEIDYKGDGVDYISCQSGQVVVKNDDDEVVLDKGEMALVKDDGKIAKSKTDESIFTLIKEMQNAQNSANLSVNDDEPTPAAHLQKLISQKAKMVFKGKAAGEYTKATNKNQILTNYTGSVSPEDIKLEINLENQTALLQIGNAKRKITKITMDMNDFTNTKTEELEDSINLGEIGFKNAVISPIPVLFGHIVLEAQSKKNEKATLMGSFLGNNAKAFAGTLIRNIEEDNQNGENYTIVLALEKE